MTDETLVEIVWIFFCSLFTAWVFGALGNLCGLSGTYWGWYWFTVVANFGGKIFS